MFDVDCTVSGEECGVGVDAVTAQHLYRIAQEALTNAVRHGGARRVEIALEGSGSERRLSVVDDGAGFVVGAQPGGMGLHIMRRRATAMRGALEIRSTVGEGTMIRSSFRVEEGETRWLG